MNSSMNYNQLPADFAPGPRDVVIGKGKKYFFHKGNAMLRDLAASMLDEYASAKTKVEKSMLISQVAEHVRLNGNFVKKDNRSDKWVIAEDLLCREKISAVFRDTLHQRCRTGGSSFAKKTIRAVEEKKRRVSAPPAFLLSQIPLDWEVNDPSQSFGSGMQPMRRASAQLPASVMMNQAPAPFPQAPTLTQTPVPMPNLAHAAAHNKGDIFGIFSFALSNINEEGDPFEPKPLFEAGRTA